MGASFRLLSLLITTSRFTARVLLSLLTTRWIFTSEPTLRPKKALQER